MINMIIAIRYLTLKARTARHIRNAELAFRSVGTTVWIVSR